MSEPRTADRRFATLLAVLLPLLILGSAGLYINQYEESKRNSVPERMEALVDLNQPSIIVFGNSLAKRDLNTDWLTSALGMERHEAVMLTVPDSATPTWYAILKNRIYANEHRPFLILVVAELSSFVGLEPLSEEDNRRLAEQLGDEEPVIAKKVYGIESGDLRWHKLRQRRGSLRDSSLKSIRDFTVGTLFTMPNDPTDASTDAKGKKGKLRRKGKGGRLVKNKQKGKSKGKTVFDRGRGVAQPAMDRVFAPDKVDWDLHNRVIPVVEHEATIDKASLPTPTDSMMPDIIRLAQEFGSKIVFVRTPLAPGFDRDYLGPEMDRAAVELTNEMGAGYVDMRTLDLRERHFEDLAHMNREGARIFTNAVANTLLEMGALKEGPVPKAILPIRPPEVRREGVAALPSLGDATSAGGCLYEVPLSGLDAISETAMTRASYPGTSPLTVVVDGTPLKVVDDKAAMERCEGTARLVEGKVQLTTTGGKPGSMKLDVRPEPLAKAGDREVYWVAPGTQLHFDFDEGWTGEDEQWGVSLVAERFGPAGDDAVAKIRVGDADASLTGRENTGRLFAELTPPVPTGPWTLSIDNPPDGAWLMLQGFIVGNGFGTNFIVGDQEENRGASLRLIGGIEVSKRIKPKYLDKPKKPKMVKKFERGPRGTGWFKAPRMAFLSDFQTMDRTPFNTRCSPLRVRQNGKFLPLANESCWATQWKGRGRFCHEAGNILFSAPDGSSPNDNGRDYDIRLDPERSCKRFFWLYPSDTLQVQPPAEDLYRFRDGISQLELDVMPFDTKPKQFQVLVKLLVNGEPRLEEAVPNNAFKRGAMRWQIDPPIPAGTDDVLLELANPNDTVYLLVNIAAISEFTDPTKKMVKPDLPAIEAMIAPVGPPVEFTAERTGDIPVIDQPAADRIVRARAPCGYRVNIPDLAFLSDTILKDGGVGRAGPVMLWEDEERMKAHSTTQQYLNRCAGAFGHTGKIIWFSPTGSPEARDEHTYTVGLDERFPSKRVDKSDVYWIYPGTTATFTVPEWNSQERGLPVVSTEVYLAQGNYTPGVATVEVYGETRQLLRPRRGLPRPTETFKPTKTPKGPITVTYSSPPDGPYVAIQTLWLGEGEKGGVAVNLSRSQPR